MATAEERLKIIVEASDKASAVIQGIGRSSANAINDITDAFSDLSVASGGIFGAYMIRQAAEYQVQLAKTAAEAERVRTAFRNLAGTDASQTFESLRTASRGAIDDVNLMLAANKAMMLGVTQSGEELTQLMVVAIERGRAMGISSQQAFNDIVTGIGRMSPLILDNLGIVTGGQRAFDDYAAALGKTADELTDVERKQMLVNKVLESASPAAREAGASALDAAGQFEKLDAQVSNLKANLGGLAGITIGPIVAVVAKEAELANSAFDKMRAHRQTLSELRDAALDNQEAFGFWNTALVVAITTINQVSAGVGLSKDGTENLTEAIENLVPWLGYFADGNREVTASAYEAGGALSYERAQAEKLEQVYRRLGRPIPSEARELNEEYRQRIQRFRSESAASQRYTAQAVALGMDPKRLAETLDEKAAEAREAEERLNRAIQLGNEAGIGAVGGAMGGTEGERRSQAARDLVEVTLAQAEATRKVTDAQFAYQLSTRDTAGQIELLTQKLSGVEEGSVEYYQILTRIQGLQNSMAKSGAKAITTDARELRSLAESLLRPTDVSAMDMAQTKLGTYTDKWDEYARRVRAAGQDVKSEWRNLVPIEILQQGEDAIRAWAAAEEQAFYSGQRPEEMNWDAFIQNARAEVERQIAKENLVNEAMQRLADAGIGGVSRADVARQFGLVDTSAVASDTASQVARGIKAVDTGKEFTDAFAEQFRAQETRWVEFGSLSVTWFGVGIKNGVAAGAGDVLIDAILPRIQEKLQGRP